MADKTVGNFAIRPLEKISFMVHDCKKAAIEFSKVTGAGPFTIARGIDTSVLYKGETVKWNHDVALGSWGRVAVELIQTNDASPAALREADPERECHVYNLAYGVEDIEAEKKRLEGIGYPCVWESGTAEKADRVMMFDTNDLLSCFVQVYEANEATRMPYQTLGQFRAGWNGQKAIAMVYDAAKGAPMEEDLGPDINAIPNGTRQFCWLNMSCKEAAKKWAELFGAGPWILSRNTPIQGLKYMGKPTDWLQDSGLGQFGSIQIELMETCDDSPAVHYQPGPHGRLHHMNWFVPDLDAETKRLEDLGYKCIWDCCCGPGSMKIKMFDADKFTGCLFEVYEYIPMIDETYWNVEQMHENWDGQAAIAYTYDNAVGSIVPEEY